MTFFKSVRWKNFLSTGNYFNEIRLDTNSNTLVYGINGSGKSSLLDAICFVLFGRAFRNINKPGLCNSINDKDCIVEIEFDTNNKSYKIIRGIKPNIFEIYCAGILVNQDASARDYQEYLEKFILKLNYKSFTQLVLLGNASFIPFMQLSPMDRRGIIEDLLGIQIFSTMNSLVKDRLLNNRDIFSEKKHASELSQQKYDIHKQHLENIKQNNESKIKEHKEDLLGVEKHIAKLSSDTQTLSNKISNLHLGIEGKSEIELRIKKISKLDSAIENNLSKIRKDIKFFSEYDDCPTCRQTIEVSFKEGELSNLASKVVGCEQGLSDLSNKLHIEQEKLSAINTTQKEIHNIHVQIAVNTTSIQESKKYIEKLNRLILELKTCKTTGAKEEIELDEIKINLTNLKKDLVDLLEEKSYYDAAAGLLKDTGIKTQIIKQYLPLINKLVNKHLAALDFFVNFNLDEAFKETIKSRYRDEFTYDSFSEGEKTKINLALLFTWRAIAKIKNSSDTNLLIMDEVVDGALDHAGIDNFMNLINTMNEQTSIFVISPKGGLFADKFNNAIQFEKIKNFSFRSAA